MEVKHHAPSLYLTSSCSIELYTLPLGGRSDIFVCLTNHLTAKVTKLSAIFFHTDSASDLQAWMFFFFFFSVTLNRLCKLENGRDFSYHSIVAPYYFINHATSSSTRWEHRQLPVMLPKASWTEAEISRLPYVNMLSETTFLSSPEKLLSAAFSLKWLYKSSPCRKCFYPLHFHVFTGEIKLSTYLQIMREAYLPSESWLCPHRAALWHHILINSTTSVISHLNLNDLHTETKLSLFWGSWRLPTSLNSWKTHT